MEHSEWFRESQIRKPSLEVWIAGLEPFLIPLPDLLRVAEGSSAWATSEISHTLWLRTISGGTKQEVRGKGKRIRSRYLFLWSHLKLHFTWIFSCF